MANVDIDRHQAAAEAHLDRVDDGGEYPLADETNNHHVAMMDGMHVEHAGEPIETDEDDEHVVAEGSEVMDELSEAFNARDADAIEELCAADCEIPGLASDIEDLSDALADLWERRPTITLTREVLDGQAVGVLWEREDTAGWAHIGVVHLDLEDDGLVGVIEFSDDATLLDELAPEPPDGDLEEGARWEEWADGADGET